MTEEEDPEAKSNAAKAPAGFVVTSGRQAKARKILQVIREAGNWKRRTAGDRRLRLLDIGTGNGEIAKNLAAEYDVVTVDVRDQRETVDGYTFVLVGGEVLPFAGGSFDIVISNHVIEHVNDYTTHIAEIARVLKDGGLAYLATPNRIWPWEVHYRLPFLHYLPFKWFIWALRSFGVYREDVRLLSLRGLKKCCGRWFAVELFSDRICKWPRRYHMACAPWIAALLRSVPLSIYRLFGWILPTLVVVLHRRV